MSPSKNINPKVISSSGDIANLSFAQRLYIARAGLAKLLILLAIAAIAGWLAWSRHVDQLDKQRTLTESSNKQLLAQTNKDITSGDYDQAVNRIKNATHTDKETQLLLISTYQSKGDYNSALTLYKEVIGAYGANLGLVEGAAQAAEQVKDYKQAIDYYKQARQFVSDGKDYATKKADLAFYDNKIKMLQAGP